MDAMPPAAETRTTCPYCGVGCGVLATPLGAVRGDPEHPANRGRLCSKGAALGETIAQPGRLLHPEVNGRRASWDAALDAVAEGFRRALAQGGPDAAALYVSGQLLTEDYYAANKLAKGFLGTANIDSNSRLCMASAVAAHRRAFGEDVVPGIYEDLEQADLVVLVGSNLAWCHPVLHQRLLAAQAARPTLRVVVVDPRRTASCEGAALHLPLRPGSDVALFAALLVHLEAAGAADAAYVAQHTDGLVAALDAAHAIAPQAAALTGLDPADIAIFCRWFAKTPRVATLWSQGVNQSSAGTDKANAIINCHLLTGRIGKPGAGPFSVTGQPNAMGGREVGALANMLAAHLEWDRPGDADLLSGYWRAPRLAAGPGLKAVDLFKRLHEGGIGALWVMATNPAVSLPDGDAVREALRRAPFLVVSDCTRESDTVDFAHVRLPALGWGEKDGTVTNSERVISRQRAFLPPPGEARPDWWIIAQVARRLGHGGAFAWRNPAEIFREHAALTGLGNNGARVFDISGLAGLTDAEYEAMPPTRWPCPAGATPRARLFADGGFTAGRARFVPTPYRAPVHAPDAHRPIVLTTGRIRDQWHTMTRTGLVPRLMAQAPEPVIALHPDDTGLPEGALVSAEGPSGAAVFRLKHDPGLPRGTGFAPMHWTGRFAAGARVNSLVPPVTDPVSGQPELKAAPARLAPFPAAWHGFVLARRKLELGAAWQASAPAGSRVWRHEAAGTETPDQAFDRLAALLAEPAAAWLTLADVAAGHHRAVLLREGEVLAALAIAPGPDLPPRDWLARLMDSPAALSAAERRALLAFRPADGPPPSPTVCACHGVTADAILRAHARGEATAAGTGCGSCKPEIAALLATAKVAVPA